MVHQKMFENFKIVVLVCYSGKCVFDWFRFCAGFSDEEFENQKTLMMARLSFLEGEAYKLVSHPFSLTSSEDIAKVGVLLMKWCIMHVCGTFVHKCFQTCAHVCTVMCNSMTMMRDSEKYVIRQHCLCAKIIQIQSCASYQ